MSLLLYLVLLTAACSITHGTPAEQGTFRAWDCEQPQNIQDIDARTLHTCPDRYPIDSVRNVTYQLLSTQHKVSNQGFRCALKETKLASTCDKQQQAERIPARSYHGVQVTINVTDCRRYLRDKTFRYKDQYLPVELHNNAVNILAYDERGRLWTHEGKHGCVGQPTIFNGLLYKNLVLTVHQELTLADEVYTFQEGGVIVQSTGERLVCHPSAAACQTPTATYLWSSPPDDCELTLVKSVTGIEVTSGDNKVFMSTDGTSIRLVQDGLRSRCGRHVIKTSDPGLFLYPITEMRQFPESTQRQPFALSTFLRHQDRQLLVNRVGDELKEVMRHECLTRKRYQGPPMEQVPTESSATSWTLGAGKFVSQSGEVLYQYQCREVIMTARNAPKCYQELPVECADPTDVVCHNRPPLFMEPLTHRLIRRGTSKPCSDVFMTKFRHQNYGWTMAIPAIHAARSP